MTRGEGKETLASLLSEAIGELTARNVSTPRLDAEVLLAHALGTGRAGLYARLHDSPAGKHARAFRCFIERRARHEPLQYITGVREFWSLEFKVDQRVLIPRPETELVVEVALRLLAQHASPSPVRGGGQGERDTPWRILDVGTGSGCIAVALATELPQVEIWATDASPDALAVAGENARRHSVAERLRFLHGDLFAPVAGEGGRFDLIVSNPPYMARGEVAALQPEVRDWEPPGALDGGADGLDFYRRLLGEGPAYLRPGGWLVMEVGQGQSPAVLRLAREHCDLTESFCVPDYAGHERVAVACKV